MATRNPRLGKSKFHGAQLLLPIVVRALPACIGSVKESSTGGGMNCALSPAIVCMCMEPMGASRRIWPGQIPAHGRLLSTVTSTCEEVWLPCQSRIKTKTR